MARATPPAPALVDLPRFGEPQQGLALLFAIVLTALGAVGLAGLFEVDGALFGVFSLSTTASIVHLATGLLGLVLSMFAGAGALFNKVGSVIYTVVFLVGLVELLTGGTSLGWATNGLHLGLALLTAAVGFGIGEGRPC